VSATGPLGEQCRVHGLLRFQQVGAHLRQIPFGLCWEVGAVLGLLTRPQASRAHKHAFLFSRP
jgi:hypothetical protein